MLGSASLKLGFGDSKDSTPLPVTSLPPAGGSEVSSQLFLLPRLLAPLSWTQTPWNRKPDERLSFISCLSNSVSSQRLKTKQKQKNVATTPSQQKYTIAKTKQEMISHRSRHRCDDKNEKRVPKARQAGRRDSTTKQDESPARKGRAEIVMGGKERKAPFYLTLNPKLMQDGRGMRLALLLLWLCPGDSWAPASRDH